MGKLTFNRFAHGRIRQRQWLSVGQSLDVATTAGSVEGQENHKLLVIAHRLALPLKVTNALAICFKA